MALHANSEHFYFAAVFGDGWRIIFILNVCTFWRKRQHMKSKTNKQKLHFGEIFFLLSSQNNQNFPPSLQVTQPSPNKKWNKSHMHLPHATKTNIVLLVILLTTNYYIPKEGYKKVNKINFGKLWEGNLKAKSK